MKFEIFLWGFQGWQKAHKWAFFVISHATLVQPPRCTSIRKIQQITSKLHQKNEKQRWVDIEWWFFLSVLTRPFGWILHKIGAHLTWMEHQVFACCTPEVESGYLWNPWECPNSYFIKNQPNYCCQSLQEKSLKNIHILMGLSTILWFFLFFKI